MPIEFEYKTAPLGGVRRLSVEEEGARLFDPDGQELARVHFAEVEAARFVETRARAMVVRRVELRSGEELFRLPLNGGSSMDAGEPPLATFYEAGAALLGALASRRPELEAELGETTGMRIVWFGIGLFALLMSAGILVAALATGVSSDKLAGGALPLLMLALLGVIITRGNRPWKPLPRVPVQQLADALSALRSAGVED